MRGLDVSAECFRCKFLLTDCMVVRGGTCPFTFDLVTWTLHAYAEGTIESQVPYACPSAQEHAHVDMKCRSAELVNRDEHSRMWRLKAG